MINHWESRSTTDADADGIFYRMQIITNNRVDALAETGVDMHPDDTDLWKACYSDAKAYCHIVQYITKCLAFAMDHALYEEIQEQRFEFVNKSFERVDPVSPSNLHSFTMLHEDAAKARCVKCFASSARDTRHGKCPGDVWEKGHRLARVGADIVFCIRFGSFSIGRTDQLYSHCRGTPWSIASRRAKARLVNGLHPHTGVAVAQPVQLVRFFGSSAPLNEGEPQVIDEDLLAICE